jgi:hypothetical protein
MTDVQNYLESEFTLRSEAHSPPDSRHVIHVLITRLANVVRIRGTLEPIGHGKLKMAIAGGA